MIAENKPTPTPKPGKNLASPNAKPKVNAAGKGFGKPFQSGNRGGPGNPLGGRIEKLRARLVKAVSEKDIDAIAKRVIFNAKKGDIGCIKELFDRLFGKSPQALNLGGRDGESLIDILRALATAKARN